MDASRVRGRGSITLVTMSLQSMRLRYVCFSLFRLHSICVPIFLFTFQSFSSDVLHRCEDFVFSFSFSSWSCGPARLMLFPALGLFGRPFRAFLPFSP